MLQKLLFALKYGVYRESEYKKYKKWQKHRKTANFRKKNIDNVPIQEYSRSKGCKDATVAGRGRNSERKGKKCGVW